MTKSKTDRYTHLAFVVVILAIIAVIVGVIWTASTGRSGQRVYLGSAVISMCLVLFLMWVFYIYQGSMVRRNLTNFSILDYPGVIGLPTISIIVLALGFFITGMINASTGNSTDSLPYLISAMVSFAVLLIYIPIQYPMYFVKAS